MEHDHGQPSAGGLVTDPVCGMTIDPAKAAGTSEAGGAVVYFCSLGCKRKFDAEPARFLASMGRPAPGAEVTKGQLAANDGAQQHAVQEDAPTAPASSVRSLPQPTQETIYTCPMHPEVRQERPGECPKCGMALEPVLAAVPATRTEWTCPMHPEIVRDEAGSCPICGMALEPRTVTARRRGQPRAARHDAPVLGQRGAHRAPPGHRDGPTSAGRRWIHGCCTVASAHGSSSRLLRRSCSGAAGPSSSAAGTRWSTAASTCSPSSPSASASPTCYSLVAALVPGVFPPSFRDAAARSGVYFEAAAVIVDAGAARPGARAAGAQPHRCRDPRAPRSRSQDGAAHAPTAASRTSRWSRYGLAIACEFVPARRCPWTASCSTA